MARLTWSGPALRDLEAITALIAHDSPAYARKFGRRLRDAPKQLTRFPQRGAMVPEFGRPNLREIVVGVYRIVYLVRPKDVFVLGIVHGNRDITRISRFDEDQT